MSLKLAILQQVFHKILEYYNLYVKVSSAISHFGDSVEKLAQWETAIQTIISIVSNVIKYPENPKYFSVNLANPKFQEK